MAGDLDKLMLWLDADYAMCQFAYLTIILRIFFPE